MAGAGIKSGCPNFTDEKDKYWKYKGLIRGLFDYGENQDLP